MSAFRVDLLVELQVAHSNLMALRDLAGAHGDHDAERAVGRVLASLTRETDMLVAQEKRDG